MQVEIKSRAKRLMKNMRLFMCEKIKIIRIKKVFLFNLYTKRYKNKF